MSIGDIGAHLRNKGWFDNLGVYALVDGQYGSTGKGVAAGLLAEHFKDRVEVVTSNAGPNSGHTSYVGDRKVVLKQLPTYAVVCHLLETTFSPLVYLNGGAVINHEILKREMDEFPVNVVLHPAAARIDADCLFEDQGNVAYMASTGQGIGPALVRKLQRRPEAVVGGTGHSIELHKRIVFMEVSQGFSLGINSGFYPHVTTRECTVAQGLADAGLSPFDLREVLMCVRTFPIRVGNTEGSSGPHYPDQREVTWEELGQQPEYTTVTKRVRRVFTWSDQQFRLALRANRPSAIFLNFVNYLNREEIPAFIEKRILQPYKYEMGKTLPTLLLGHGPKSTDVELW